MADHLSSAAKRHVALGYVATAHGIRGEFRVRPYNTATEVLGEPGTFQLLRDGKPVAALEVQSVRAASDYFIMSAPRVRTRDDALALQGCELAVPREALPALPEGEYYHIDLLGLSVVDEGGLTLGTVAEVIDYPSVACLKVVGPAQPLEVPLLERYLVGVEMANRRIRVRDIGELRGLLEPRRESDAG